MIAQVKTRALTPTQDSHLGRSSQGEHGPAKHAPAQIRGSVAQALERVRKAARQRKKEKFTALLHHISVETLEVAFYALKRKAAPGVDGVTWLEYEADLERRLIDLHGRIVGPTGLSRPAGRIFQRRMDGSGLWRLPPWKTKSFRARLSWC
jgi:hypothetical protein